MVGGTARKKRKPSTYGYAVLGVVFVFVFINWALSWLHKPDTSALPPLTAAGKPYAAALEDRLQDAGPLWAGGAGLSAKEAGCVAPPWTMLVDPEELDRLGATPEGFGAHPDVAFRKVGLKWDDATRLRAAYERCGLTTLDLSRRAVAFVLVDPPPGTSEDEAAAARACAEDQLTSEFTDHAFNASLTAGGLTPNDRDLVLFSNSMLALCDRPGS